MLISGCARDNSLTFPRLAEGIKHCSAVCSQCIHKVLTPPPPPPPPHSQNIYYGLCLYCGRKGSTPKAIYLWHLSIHHPSIHPSIHQHFQTFPLKPLGQLNSNFILRQLMVCERKFFSKFPSHITKIAA